MIVVVASTRSSPSTTRRCGPTSHAAPAIVDDVLAEILEVHGTALTLRDRNAAGRPVTIRLPS
jgi:hypothetical protein